MTDLIKLRNKIVDAREKRDAWVVADREVYGLAMRLGIDLDRPSNLVRNGDLGDAVADFISITTRDIGPLMAELWNAAPDSVRNESENCKEEVCGYEDSEIHSALMDLFGWGRVQNDKG